LHVPLRDDAWLRGKKIPGSLPEEDNANSEQYDHRYAPEDATQRESVQGYVVAHSVPEAARAPRFPLPLISMHGNQNRLRSLLPALANKDSSQLSIVGGTKDQGRV
jgi:hypothetical protein